MAANDISAVLRPVTRGQTSRAGGQGTRGGGLGHTLRGAVAVLRRGIDGNKNIKHTHAARTRDERDFRSDFHTLSHKNRVKQSCKTFPQRHPVSEHSAV